MNAINHLERVRSAATTLLNSLEEVRAIDYEYVKGDMGEVLSNEKLEENQIAVTNEDLKGAITTFRAINDLMGQGHAENLYKLKR